MENAAGMELKLTDYGASLVSLKVKDRTGEKRDVVLGYDDVEGYENGAIFLGATVGRNANRIRGAAFELGGRSIRLTQMKMEITCIAAMISITRDFGK